MVAKAGSLAAATQHLNRVVEDNVGMAMIPDHLVEMAHLMTADRYARLSVDAFLFYKKLMLKFVVLVIRMGLRGWM